MTAYLNAIQRYFDFSGRTSRSQFWLFTLVYLGILIVALFLSEALFGDGGDDYPILVGIAYFFHLIPSLSATVRRLHDTDRSGWWILIGLVPVVGIVALIVFACLPSTGPNRFGAVAGLPATGSSYSPAGPHQGPAASHLDQLEKLAALRNSGAIDDAEFDRMKSDLLAGRT